MPYVKAFIIKFVMITAVLWVVLELFGRVSFTDILITSIILTGVSYIGDVYILPKINNVTATIADFALAFVIIWALGAVLFENPIALGTASLVTAAILAIGEAFFHLYMKRQVHESSSHAEEYTVIPKRDFKTEFGLDMEEKKDDEKGDK